MLRSLRLAEARVRAMPVEMNVLAAKWMTALVSAGEQALVDLALSSASELSFVRHEDDAIADLYLEELDRRAQTRGFVTARVALGPDCTFEALDVVVRAVLKGLAVPGARRSAKRGLLPLLDTFVQREGAAAVATFDARLGQFGTNGDLFTVARAYVDSAKRPRREAARVEAWLSGVELARVEHESAAVSALSPRTAKRALAELTRLVQTLGYAGTLVLFTNGEALLSHPSARREDAYTVLRELVDNTDSGRGTVATRVVLAGTTPLFVGPRSLASLQPLQTRIAAGDAALPTPHAPMVDLVFSLFAGSDLGPRPPTAPPPGRAAEMRTLVRGAQGLPPTEAVLSMSIGHEEIDATIDGLFELSAMDGSVFALLSGGYGSGKTHLLLHLAARALADRRPVLRLSLERLDADLGNPQRHLRRLLEQAELPLTGRPSLLDLLHVWTRTPARLDALLESLEHVEAEGTDASPAAARALRAARATKMKGKAVESVLGAVDLENKTNAPNYRQDAYGRLLLWLTLLERLEGCAGPVLLIDEAENLYKGGCTRAERRTALRSLAFYCGGALPRACVVLAITPDVLPELRAEAKELLEEVSEQRTLLASEDAGMFRRRLTRAKPQVVPPLKDEHRALLAARVRKTHAAVRGHTRDAGWNDYVATLAAPELTPRDIVRRTIERLERLWWGATPA